MTEVIAVIPARYHSTRFPAKALAKIAGKPMILRTWERVCCCSCFSKVLVATDDERIALVIREAGGHAVLTSPSHTSGTDRIAEAIASYPADIIVNVQGDEPLVPPEPLEQLVQMMIDNPSTPMGTLAVPLHQDDPRVHEPSVVKIACSHQGFALYFSRLPIPYARDQRPPDVPYLQHVGIYAYRRWALERLVKMPPSPLERCEALEQLRALEAGMTIRVVVTQATFIGVDRPEDVPLVEAELKKIGLL